MLWSSFPSVFNFSATPAEADLDGDVCPRFWWGMLREVGFSAAEDLIGRDSGREGAVNGLPDKVVNGEGERLSNKTDSLLCQYDLTT